MKQTTTTRLTSLVTVGLLIATTVFSIPVHAATTDDFKAVSRGWPFFNANAEAGGSCPTSPDDSSPPSSDSDKPTATTGSDYSLQLPKINDSAKLAASINEYLAKHANKNSPFQGKGELFVRGGSRSGINPFFVIAIAKHESGYGTAGVATNGSNNAFGLTASASQPYVRTNRRWYKFPSFDKSLVSDAFPATGNVDQPFDEFQYLKRGCLDLGIISTTAVMMKYAPPSENDTAGYIAGINAQLKEMVELAGDSIDVTTVGDPVDPGGGGTDCVVSDGTGEPEDFQIIKKDLFNSSDTAKTIDVKAVVLHWTAVSPNTTPEALAAAMKARTDACGKNGCSVQFYVDGGGNVYQMTPEENSGAVHASSANGYAIGIEIGAGPCNAAPDACSTMLLDNKTQAASVTSLVTYLVSKYKLPYVANSTSAGITSHHKLDPGRKFDVGDAYYALIVKAVQDKIKSTSTSGGSNGQ